MNSLFLTCSNVMAILQSESRRIVPALNALNLVKGLDIDVQVMHPDNTFALEKFTFGNVGFKAEGEMTDNVTGEVFSGEIHFDANGACVAWTFNAGDFDDASLYGVSITTDDEDGLGAMLELVSVIIDDEISFDLF